MLIRDIEIEMNLSRLGRDYIGKKALKKNLFFPVEISQIPLNTEKQLTLF